MASQLSELDKAIKEAAANGQDTTALQVQYDRQPMGAGWTIQPNPHCDHECRGGKCFRQHRRDGDKCPEPKLIQLDSNFNLNVS